MFNLKGFTVARAYNGKRGCMCGCNGTYVDAPGPAMTRRVNKVLNFVGPVRPDAANYGDKASYSSTPFFGELRYVYVEENGRNTTIYFK